MTKTIQILLALFFSFSAMADEVMLLDSTVFTGHIVKLSSCEVKMKVKGVALVFHADEISYAKFDNIYSKHLKKYKKRLLEQKKGCFYVTNLEHLDFELHDEEEAKIFGTNHTFKSGGNVSTQLVDRSPAMEEEDAALVLVLEEEKKRRRRQLINILLFGSILNTVIGFL